MSMIGKVIVIPKLDNHWDRPLTARPEPRIWFGNISPSMIHMTGPHDVLNNIEYRTAEQRAIGPWLPLSANVPLTTSAVEKITARMPRVMAIPIEPTKSKGLRPTRSTSAVAMKQARMLAPPLMTLMSSASLSLKPADCHNTAP